MLADNPTVLGLGELKEWMSQSPPDNSDPKSGYALVNVSDPNSYEHENIAGSINIPEGKEYIYEERYSVDKDIILYSELGREVSMNVARELVRSGFRHVYVFEAGMPEWKDAVGIVD